VVVTKVSYIFPRTLSVEYVIPDEHMMSGVYIPIPSGSDTVNVDELTQRIQDDLVRRFNDPNTAIFQKAVHDLMGMELSISIPEKEKEEGS
jgi:hypothetical protein